MYVRVLGKKEQDKKRSMQIMKVVRLRATATVLELRVLGHSLLSLGFLGLGLQKL